MWNICQWKSFDENESIKKNKENEENKGSVFSSHFLGKIQGLLCNLINNDLACEMLNKKFLKTFFRFLSVETREKIQIDLIIQFLRFLELKSQELEMRPGAHNGEPPDVTSDQFWKIKYMFSQNFHVLAEGLNPFSEEITSRLGKILRDNPMLAASTLNNSKVDQNENQPLELEETKPQEPNNGGEYLLPTLVFGIYKQYISLESFEIRSMFFSSLISICKNLSTPVDWDSHSYQIEFAKSTIKIVNQFILFDQSFYVKMRISHFLVEILKISVENPKVNSSTSKFMTLKFAFDSQINFEPNMLPPNSKNNPGENGTVLTTASSTISNSPFGMSIKQNNMFQKKNIEENIQAQNPNMDPMQGPNIDELTVKSTSTSAVELTPQNLIDYCYNVNETLCLDSNIEIYREKFTFVKHVFVLSSKFPEQVEWLRKKLIEGAGKAHLNSNLKFREEFLSQILWIINNCRMVDNPPYIGDSQVIFILV